MTSAGSVQLHRLTYVSTVSKSLRDDEIAALVAQAQHKNQRLSVTGLLLFNGLNFLQTLEGPGDRVLDLFSQISQDARHNGVVCVQTDKPASRAFDAWAMAYAPVSRAGFTGNAFAPNGFIWPNAPDALPDELKSLYLAFNSLARGLTEAV